MKSINSNSMIDSSVRVSSKDKAKRNGRRSAQPISGILVNQGIGKIKLEEGVPAPNKMETNSFTNQPGNEVGDKEGVIFTEEFTVTNEDVSIQASEDPGQDDHGRSSCPCREEIESLKNSVKQLTMQVQKQNQVIGGIKSSLRNAVLSLMTCCQDEKEDPAFRGDDGDDHDIQESPVIVNTFSKTSTSGFVVEDPLLIDNDDNFASTNEENYQDLQDSCSSISITKRSRRDGGVQISRDFYCHSSVSPKASFFTDQNADDQEIDLMGANDNEVDANAEVDDHENDDDISYVPDDRESVNSEGPFECSNCGKNYKSKMSLSDHMRKAHSKKRRLFNCHLCPKVCTTSRGIDLHIKSTHERVRYKCAYCPRKFSDASNLRRHEKSIHKKGGPPTA